MPDKPAQLHACRFDRCVLGLRPQDGVPLGIGRDVSGTVMTTRPDVEPDHERSGWRGARLTVIQFFGVDVDADGVVEITAAYGMGYTLPRLRQ